MRGSSCLVSPNPRSSFFEQPKFQRLLGDREQCDAHARSDHTARNVDDMD